MTSPKNAYKTLYSRFRPVVFSQLVGQDRQVTGLQHAVKSGSIAHAYLFSGPRGCGKTSTALILARVVNCEDPNVTTTGEPCNECVSCTEITQQVSRSVQVYDAATNSSVDQMRTIIADAGLAVPGRYRVIIIDEAHGLSQAAQNALLNTLETPPPGVIFVLTTTDPQRLLATIRSRCIAYEFTLVPPTLMESHVRRVLSFAKIDQSDANIERAVKVGAGSVRDTLSALEAGFGNDEPAKDFTVDIVRGLSMRDAKTVLVSLASAVEAGENLNGLGEGLSRALCDHLMVVLGAGDSVSSLDYGDRDAVAAQLTARGAAAGIEHIGSALQLMRGGVDGRVALELALMRCIASIPAPPQAPPTPHDGA